MRRGSGGQAPMTAQVTARRLALARPGTATVLGSLVLVEVAAVAVRILGFVSQARATIADGAE
jgi:hypothetical protein